MKLSCQRAKARLGLVTKKLRDMVRFARESKIKVQ